MGRVVVVATPMSSISSWASMTRWGGSARPLTTTWLPSAAVAKITPLTPPLAEPVARLTQSPALLLATERRWMVSAADVAVRWTAPCWTVWVSSCASSACPARA